MFLSPPSCTGLAYQCIIYTPVSRARVYFTRQAARFLVPPPPSVCPCACVNVCMCVEYRVLITNVCTDLVATLSLFSPPCPLDETSPSCRSSSATCWPRLRPSFPKASFRETPFASPRLTRPSSGEGFSVKSKMTLTTA